MPLGRPDAGAARQVAGGLVAAFVARIVDRLGTQVVEKERKMGGRVAWKFRNNGGLPHVVLDAIDGQCLVRRLALVDVRFALPAL